MVTAIAAATSHTPADVRRSPTMPQVAALAIAFTIKLLPRLPVVPSAAAPRAAWPKRCPLPSGPDREPQRFDGPARDDKERGMAHRATTAATPASSGESRGLPAVMWRVYRGRGGAWRLALPFLLLLAGFAEGVGLTMLLPLFIALNEDAGRRSACPRRSARCSGCWWSSSRSKPVCCCW